MKILKDLLGEFKQFLLRGNVVDLAVGVVVGAAFGTVVSSLVKNILTPLIAAIAKVPDFANLKFTLNGSMFMYGEFINALISFVLVAAAVFFFVIKPMNILIAKTKKGAPIDPTTKKCTECLSEMPIAAKRCAHCTQVQA
jgi:large conductance mechanosensitive channel